MERWTVYFSGRVQGVGFRYTACQLARGFELGGWVRNLDDGRVELVMEGDPKVLEDFLATLRQRMHDYIQHWQLSRSPATGQFTAQRLVIGQ